MLCVKYAYLQNAWISILLYRRNSLHFAAVFNSKHGIVSLGNFSVTEGVDKRAFKF